MENASKALIIAGAILLSILIIAIGIFIFNGANSTITDSMTSMSTQEIEAFNNQLLSYDGKQSGSNVKALIGRLIANSNTYKDETNKIPKVKTSSNGVSASKAEPSKVYKVTNAGATTDYVTGLGNIRNNLEDKHEYTVQIRFNSTGLISEIGILYNSTDSITYNN